VLERNKNYIEPGPGEYSLVHGNSPSKLGSLILPKKKSASKLPAVDGKRDEIAPGYYDTDNHNTIG